MFCFCHDDEDADSNLNISSAANGNYLKIYFLNKYNALVSIRLIFLTIVCELG